MNDYPNHKESFITNSPEDSFNKAKTLGTKLKGGELIFLIGDLGAGKTIFAKGIASSINIDPDEITSPTFSIMNVYDISTYKEARLSLVHTDLYRIQNTEELEELGLDDYLKSNFINIIEWGEKYKDYFLNKAIILIRIDILNEENNRRITIEYHIS